MNNDQKHLAVPAPLVQRVIDYLKSKPFEEVAQIINGLLQCPIVNITPAEPPAPADELKKK